MGALDCWEFRLNAVVNGWRDKAFEWGSSDCLHFCMACETAIHGTSKLHGFPAYKTEKGGFRHMKRKGYEAIPDFIDSLFSRILPVAARRGDWVLFCEPNGDAFGVVVGRRVAVMGPDGLKFLPVSNASAAWRIEH